MSTTLSYGFIKPADGDYGSTFWSQLAADIQQLNDHSHNGTDSAQISSSSIQAVSHTVDTTTHASDPTQGWVVQSDGGYRRTIAIASYFSSLQFDKCHISWRVYTSTSAGELLYDYIQPTIVKTAISTYDVYLNDITNPFKVVYTS